MWIIRLVVLLGLHQPFAQVEATTYGYTTDNGNLNDAAALCIFFQSQLWQDKSTLLYQCFGVKAVENGIFH